MYQGGHGIQAYKQARVTTADPKGLVLMCYEGAISSLKLAKEKYLSHDYEVKAQALQKTHDILNVLMQSLDFEKGKTIAAGLNSIYSYMMRRVMEGDLQNNMEAFDEVIGMLEELESAWKEISTTPRSKNASDSNVTIPPEKKRLEVSGVIGGAC